MNISWGVGIFIRRVGRVISINRILKFKSIRAWNKAAFLGLGQIRQPSPSLKIYSIIILCRALVSEPS